ncbi:GNAT superfamily N-acetyltransferase [Caldalkalibacillus uzonensis]|uniref:GNAT superfamily N-acetyltransferase n=1 Tax=Caldalkalibacillus uzonensis TaxID=353224 RepID=A0ABU0CV82_9BACI|nr:GNAT family N-acetyltransferase [Caldalkalibacillus uzonensis]MDQ0340329.1 GNAT superfamily N-acetyltransferase [Caldalkalibacillus uzonensis]
MSSAIVPLDNRHYHAVYTLLSHQEPWSIIAFDALLQYGLNHPDHRWFREVHNGRTKGIIYLHDQLLQVCYPSLPQRSGLGMFLRRYVPHFIIHGQQQQLAWLKKQLAHYDTRCLDKSLFVVQSELTPALINQPLPVPEDIRLRLAVTADYVSLMSLYSGSEVEQQVDGQLLWQAIMQGRVIVAEQKQLVGTVMCLKESPRYVLLGGLYVTPRARSQGIASLLGQRLVQMVLRKGKQVCFYYHDSTLSPFYQRAAFQPLGDWHSYSFTSKQTMFFNGGS